MRPFRLSGCIVIAALVAAAPAAAQASDALYSRWSGLTGIMLQSFAFDSGITVKSASQWVLPVVVVAPIGRSMSIDLTTDFASGQIQMYGGSAPQTLSGLTDTQLRLLYTLDRDRAVVSLALNLPTGQHSDSTSQFAVAAAMGSNYLSFPVSSFGTAFGVTGGLAYALPAGAWNVGLSGSVRYVGSYALFKDASVTYKPGIEMRLRAGADRVIGQSSRLLLGLTTSTFSADEFTGSGPFAGLNYKPGLRFIGDASYLRVFGRSTLTFGAWDYYRLAGDINSVSSSDTQENIFNAELRFAHPVAPGLTLEPLVSFRQWSPSNYRGGRLYSGGLAARYTINDRLSASIDGRLSSGWVYVRTKGRANLTGTGLQLFLRYQR
ncbi:MAG TPA: hypothetical protein VNG95_00435 [Gemmatimonadales bacterium]|nr:hypothetical protein [Gemmatimonadales bacterium]